MAASESESRLKKPALSFIETPWQTLENPKPRRGEGMFSLKEGPDGVPGDRERFEERRLAPTDKVWLVGVES